MTEESKPRNVEDGPLTLTQAPQERQPSLLLERESGVSPESLGCLLTASGEVLGGVLCSAGPLLLPSCCVCSGVQRG